MSRRADLRENSLIAQGTMPPRAMRHTERVFPGSAEQVAAVRAFVTAEVAGFTDLDEVMLLASEVAANAVLHTRSGLPGGVFTVSVARGCDRVRVEVIDQGAHLVPAVRSDDEHGRGLLVVNMLASRWGVTVEPGRHVVWFECLDRSALAPSPVTGGAS